MNIKKILFLFLILFFNFAYADGEVEEKVKFRLNIGMEKCLISNPTECDSFLRIDSKELILRGDPGDLRGNIEFTETVLGVTFSTSVTSRKIFNSYDFFIWIAYSDGEKIIETKFYVITPTPRDIDYTQVYGQNFRDSEFEYKPYFLFNGV